MLALIGALPPDRYGPLVFALADTDTTSEARAAASKVRGWIRARALPFRAAAELARQPAPAGWRDPLANDLLTVIPVLVPEG